MSASEALPGNLLVKRPMQKTQDSSRVETCKRVVGKDMLPVTKKVRRHKIHPLLPRCKIIASMLNTSHKKPEGTKWLGDIGTSNPRLPVLFNLFLGLTCHFVEECFHKMQQWLMNQSSIQS